VVPRPGGSFGLARMSAAVTLLGPVLLLMFDGFTKMPSGRYAAAWILRYAL
jgi:hypothetical protein